MMMHKNDEYTEAGKLPPPDLVLFIAPGATHVTMVFEKSPLIGSVVVDLLDAKAS
jgi:hypothetical protein